MSMLGFATTHQCDSSSPKTNGFIDIDDTDPIPDGSYPAGTSPLTHIIFSGLLGEYSNAPPIHQGIPLVRRPRFMPRSVFAALPPRIQPCLFALYQTGMHGPQNGWKLICVEEGNDPEEVGRYLEGLGRIERDSKGMIIFQPPWSAAHESAGVLDTAENDVNVQLLDDSPDDYARVISHLLHSSSIPSISLSTYGASPGETDGTLGSSPTQSQGQIPAVRGFETVLSSDRATLFALCDDRAGGGVSSGSTIPEEQPKRYLVLMKEGHDTGVIRKKCMEMVDDGFGAGSFFIFGLAKREEGIVVYDQQGILREIGRH